MPEVGRISITPVKGFLLAHPEGVELTEHGVPGDRVFSLVEEDGTRVRSSLNAWHNLVAAVHEPESERLMMRFPGGQEVSGDAVPGGDVLDIAHDGRSVPARVVDGPWAELLSVLAKRPVRLVRTAHPNAVKDAPASLVSDGRWRASAAKQGAKSMRAASGCCSRSRAAPSTRKTTGSAGSCGSATP